MGKIANEELLKRINERFPDQVTVVGEPFGMLTVETGREQIIAVLNYLKTDPTLQFGYLTDLTAIHYPGTERQIGVIYHLHSLVNNVRIRLKVFLNDGDFSKVDYTSSPDHKRSSEMADTTSERTFQSCLPIAALVL